MEKMHTDSRDWVAQVNDAIFPSREVRFTVSVDTQSLDVGHKMRCLCCIYTGKEKVHNEMFSV